LILRDATGEAIIMLAHNFEVAYAESSVRLSPFAIQEASMWRRWPQDTIPLASQSSAAITRWRNLKGNALKVVAESPVDCSVIGIALRNMDTRFAAFGRVLHDGATAPGTLLVTGPDTAVEAIYRGPFDELHLYVPNEMVAACSRELGRDDTRGLCAGAVVMRDSIVERLARSVIEMDDVGDSPCQIYLDCITTAIVARLLVSMHKPKTRGTRKLVSWRLKRATDYIEARLTEPLRLADIAAAAELTPMHFAAQFRAATGLRPHEYVMRRRVEHAQRMLVTDNASLVDAALSVGFKTQAHFTCIFKRFVGQTPRAWRQTHRSLAAA
jgi:AraC family transcriptional regulator